MPTYVLSKRACTISAFFALAFSTSKDDNGEFRQRAAAINAITTVSGLQEGCRRQHRPRKQSDPPLRKPATRRHPYAPTSAWHPCHRSLIESKPTQYISALAECRPRQRYVQEGSVTARFWRYTSRASTSNTSSLTHGHSSAPIRCAQRYCITLTIYAIAETLHEVRLCRSVSWPKIQLCLA